IAFRPPHILRVASGIVGRAARRDGHEGGLEFAHRIGEGAHGFALRFHQPRDHGRLFANFGFEGGRHIGMLVFLTISCVLNKVCPTIRRPLSWPMICRAARRPSSTTSAATVVNPTACASAPSPKPTTLI